jgi:hypothetical protein
MLLESGVNYVIDLSHMQIIAQQSGKIETNLLKELLQSERCIEVHVSTNDGKKDLHHCLSETSRPWWIDLLDLANPNATIFSEGMVHH